MNPSAASLRDLELPGIASFHQDPGGLTELRVSTTAASARIFLHGAHVAEFQPAGQRPVLFMSAASHFAPNKPIRGGVPVIFPWFGPRSGHPESPAHGFARTNAWEVESLQSSDGTNVEAVLKLTSSPATKALWPHDFILRHRIRIGASLEMELEVENRSAEPFSFEEALHTYFSVSDVRKTSVTGLEGTRYVDKTDGMKIKTEGDAPIRITAETDRVYLQTQTTTAIDDPGLARRIEIAKAGSDATVVWNPWVAKAKAMADFGDEEWPAMICVETANAGESAVTLAPGAVHRMRARIAVTPLG